MSERSIGLVVAVEMDAVLAKYGTPAETLLFPGYEVKTYLLGPVTLYAVDSGAGEISAAAATQFLITKFDVDLILNFGVVGALSPEMAVADLCVVKRVVHYDYDTSSWDSSLPGQYPGMDSPYLIPSPRLLEAAVQAAPALLPVTCASADKFVDSPEAKTALRETWQADICEMESAGIVLTCLRSQVPCLLIKAVSDSLTGGGREFAAELQRASAACFDIVDHVLRTLYVGKEGPEC